MQKKTLRMLVLVFSATVLLSGTGCNKLRARDQCNKGIEAYKAGNYEVAIVHFRNAVRYDKDLKIAHLYLATAYMQQYVPTVDTPENKANATQAIEQYQAVLASDSKDIVALKGMAGLYMTMQKFDASREYYKRAIAADPNDVEAYYSIGMVDWSSAYKDISERKAKVGLSVEDPLKGRQVCEEIKMVDGPLIEEGLAMLQTAMEKRQDFDDAMAYTNLLYRRKADTECGDPDAAARDRERSEDWSVKAEAARKKRERAASGRIVIEQQKK